MTRLLAPLALAATIAATVAFAQTPAPVHSATINSIKVSGVTATSATSGVGAGSHDSVTNLLDNFSDVQPAMPVLASPASTPQLGAGKDCATASC
jgi:hypothetical protein